MKQQDQIEVFLNEAGSISIKQSDSYGEDVIVTVWPANVRAVIDALETYAPEARNA